MAKDQSRLYPYYNVSSIPSPRIVFDPNLSYRLQSRSRWLVYKFQRNIVDWELNKLNCYRAEEVLIDFNVITRTIKLVNR